MAAEREERLTTGIAGLDTLLHGGLIPRRTYLIRGGPGTGKTILGLNFLHSGIAQDETCQCLYISLGAPEDKLRTVGASVGLDLHEMHFLDLTPPPIVFREQKTYQFFSTAEVERGPITKQIIETIERLHPARVVVDSVTTLRYLTPDLLQFRREMLSFIQYMTEQGITVYLISESGASLPDEDLQFMADGIITLTDEDSLRTVAVTKYTASGYQPGQQAMRISDEGVQVTTIVAVQVERITGDMEITQSGISYLADNIVFLRYLEINGVLRKAIGVLKKQLSGFEQTLREFDITTGGVHVGKPLTRLRGILRGEPEWITPPRDGNGVSEEG